MEVTVNGEKLEIAGGFTLGQWLENIGRDRRTVAIERNGMIVPRALYDETPLVSGDRLELVTFVQGG